MALVGILSPLLSLVAFAAFIWLVVVAFKRSVLWGLLVLFLSPITAIIFAIKYWEESKKPFLAYAGSSALSIALLVYMFSAMGGFQMIGMANRMAQGDISDEEAAQFMVEQMERMQKSGMLSPEEEEELRRMQQMVQEMQQQQQTEQAYAEPGTQLSPTTSTPPVRSTAGNSPSRPRIVRLPRGDATRSSGDEATPPGYRRIAVGDAGKYLGRRIRVTGTDGTEHKGLLTEADSNSIVLERYLASGTISYELSAREVDSVLVAYR